MLEWLRLENVGPAPEFELTFESRVNLITGDNGLGKSFLLDVAWWALTGSWLAEVNPRVNSGHMARPTGNKSKPSIEFQLRSPPALSYENAFVEKRMNFDFSIHQWFDVSDIINKKTGRRTGALVIQSCIDNEFGVFDSIRGDYGFQSNDVQNGLERDGKISCNGLIRDWTIWQLENGDAFKQLTAALRVLSPDETETLEPGKPTRVSVDDVRDIPTLKMPYGQEVPIIHASAGIRRVVALAYLLVWAWQEHLRAAELKNQEPIREVILLVDELEEHLHPRWQRVILPALLEVAKTIMAGSDVRVQIIAATHSPLVMASLEPLFDPAQDAWFDLNLVDGTVKLERMTSYRQGDANAWLQSAAFDMPGTGSVQVDAAKERAAKALENSKTTKKRFLELDQELRTLLTDTDEFWIRWRFVGQKKGWL
jgi:hypothetical protein